MGKKIDLSSKPNNEFNQKKHNNRLSSPSLPSKDTEEDSNEELSKKEQMQKQVEETGKAVAKEIAKKVAIAHGVPSVIANSKVVDKILDKGLDKAIDKTKKAIKIAKIISIVFAILNILSIVMAIMPILIIIIIIIMFMGNEYNENNNQVAGGGYYSPRCNEITVIFVDKNNNYAVTNSATYSLDDYVAGVVAAEVGGFNNLEIYKTFAVAARTFGLKHVDDNCSIEGSARRQAFKDITSRSTSNHKLIYQAVEETKNEVLLSSSNELYGVHYDAFCSIDKDDNYYTIQQKNQKIPVDWVENHTGIKALWKQGTCAGNHGMGMSQYGSLYLAETQGYTYKDIIDYYFKDEDVRISSKSFITSIAGLDIKETKNVSYKINEPLTKFLESHGSSLEQYNDFIKNSVLTAGVGTREGVVTAAVSMINYLYDNFDAKMPYYWGGKHKGIGISKKFGEYRPSKPSRSGKIYYHISFDCSGFVQWAIINGGFNDPGTGTSNFNSKFFANSCLEKDSNCLGQPGDLINSPDDHVVLIVAVDEASGKYMVAESTGAGVIMQQRNIHSGGNTTRVLFMDDYYQNEVNTNYAV